RLPEVRIGVSSMLVGCIKPCILCREGTEEREASMMFAHELIHYKHHDNALLLFATLIACLYWYNPLIWIVRGMLREDIEVLCDSRTLEECGIVGTEYAMMLCRNSAFSELAYTAGCHMSASGRHLKNRLRTISLRKRRNFLTRAGSILLCTAIMLLCLTNPIVSQSSEYSVYIDRYAALTGADERAMHFQNSVTVSDYLSQVGVLVTEKAGEGVWQQIGGNLEKFKRICAASDLLSNEVKKELQKLKTDEALTNKSCALLTDCIVKLLSEGAELDLNAFLLLPDVVSVTTMNTLLTHLTENEANAVLSCYNRGVRGANVRFERVYTSAMMELILSRVNNDWLRTKFSRFYQKIESGSLDEYALLPEVRDMLDAASAGGDFYLCDPSITNAEENILQDILQMANAGEQEDVYYRKNAEDGCDWETAAFLFYRAGYTYEDMFRSYAEIGENASRLSVGGVSYPMLRDAENVTLHGNPSIGVREALLHAYSLGILDADEGILDAGERLSCGESLAAAYRVVYFAVSGK
ncbi:MAG: M56 family metallopeptidase, partial [Eubacteriales bacterium]